MFLEFVGGLSLGSHKKVKIRCDFLISEKCKKEFYRPYKDIIRYRKNNGEKDICLQCSRRLKNSGRSNPNCKIKDIDDNFFEKIDTKEKAYLLGWIGSDGHIGNVCFTIGINKKDIDILKKIKNIISKDTVIKKNIFTSMIYFTINSKKIAEDLRKLFRIGFSSKKSYIIKFPYIKEEFYYDFLRGYFDGDGSIRNPSISRTLECKITSSSISFLEDIQEKIKIPCQVHNIDLTWNSNNALDFLGKLYDKEEYFYLERKKQRYLYWANYIPIHCKKFYYEENCFIFKWKKTNKNAVEPFKERVTDTGFDLTLIELIDKNNDIYTYETGIIIQPEFGWYLELAVRSSLHKKGYILANSVGIIDRTYINSIKVVLYKFDKNKPDLELPIRAVQLIPKMIIHPKLIEIKDNEMNIKYDISSKSKNGLILGNSNNDTIWNTSRGTKGFGSSGT